MKPRAVCDVRESVGGPLMAQGLDAAGFAVMRYVPEPGPEDVLVIWNRYGASAAAAALWERANGRVVVAENGYTGRRWRGRTWTALAIGHHAGAGYWIEGATERWDSWGVALEPWRLEGERVVLGQRGIGEPGVAAPPHWAEQAQRRYGGRIRPHPRAVKVETSIEQDLASGVNEVLTWNSGAAIFALMLGVAVHYEFPKWIGASAARLICGALREPVRDDAARLRMFRRLAWSQWEDEEIGSGVAFRHLLQ